MQPPRTMHTSMNWCQVYCTCISTASAISTPLQIRPPGATNHSLARSTRDHHLTVRISFFSLHAANEATYQPHHPRCSFSKDFPSAEQYCLNTTSYNKNALFEHSRTIQHAHQLPQVQRLDQRWIQELWLLRCREFPKGWVVDVRSSCKTVLPQLND